MGFEHIMALNKNGVSFLDQITHETLIHYPFTEVRIYMIFNRWRTNENKNFIQSLENNIFFIQQVISTRKVQTEDGTLFLDMKCGNLMQQRITRIQTDQVRNIYMHIHS